MAWGAQQPRARNAGSHRRSRLLTCERPPPGASLPLPAGRLASAPAGPRCCCCSSSARPLALPPRGPPRPSGPAPALAPAAPHTPRAGPSRPGLPAAPPLSAPPPAPPPRGASAAPRPAGAAPRKPPAPSRRAAGCPGQSRRCPLRHPRAPPAAAAILAARAEATALGTASQRPGQPRPALSAPARQPAAVPIGCPPRLICMLRIITPGGSRQPPRQRLRHGGARVAGPAPVTGSRPPPRAARFPVITEIARFRQRGERGCA